MHLWVLLYNIIFTTFFILQGPNDTEPITLQDDYFNRYENPFSNTPWGSNTFNFEAGNKSLSLDIENISITQDILIAWYLKNYIIIVIIYGAFTAFYYGNMKMYCI